VEAKRVQSAIRLLEKADLMALPHQLVNSLMTTGANVSVSARDYTESALEQLASHAIFTKRVLTIRDVEALSEGAMKRIARAGRGYVTFLL
jgi:hypothetical protein